MRVIFFMETLSLRQNLFLLVKQVDMQKLNLSQQVLHHWS